jgi:hypothetical protein
MTTDTPFVLLPNTPELDEAKRAVLIACESLASLIVPTVGEVRAKGITQMLGDGGTMCVEASIDEVNRKRVVLTLVSASGTHRMEVAAVRSPDVPGAH